jgi:hypothetical protein
VSQPDTDRPLLALLLRLMGIAGFAIMAVLIKLASESGVHLAEIIFWRQIVSVPIVLAWSMMAGGVRLLATHRPRAHAVRALYGLAGMVCNFGGVILLPLAEATTLSSCAKRWAGGAGLRCWRDLPGSWLSLSLVAGTSRCSAPRWRWAEPSWWR